MSVASHAPFVDCVFQGQRVLHNSQAFSNVTSVNSHLQIVQSLSMAIVNGLCHVAQPKVKDVGGVFPASWAMLELLWLLWQQGVPSWASENLSGATRLAVPANSNRMSFPTMSSLLTCMH